MTQEHSPASSSVPCTEGIDTFVISSSSMWRNATSLNWALFAHRKTPTLSTWAVAKKSPVGEKVREVEMLVVRKASTS